MLNNRSRNKSNMPKLVASLLAAVQIPDLRNKIFFTIFMLIIFRFVAHVPVPGVDTQAVGQAFEQNAIKLGLDNPFNEAESAIDSIADELSYVTLDEPVFPSIENPLMPIMEDTPITPTSLNLPSIDVNAVNAQVQKNIRPDLTRQQLFDFLFPQG